MHPWVTRGAQASASGRQTAAGPGRVLPHPLGQHGWLWRAPRRSRKCSVGSDRPMLSSHEEYAFSLNQYMVVLEKPIGLTLAPDPATGDVYVQEIQEGLSAAESRLVLVGDKLLLCSAVFDDEMWRASDLQRTRWAINNRPGKVKLVLERSNGEPLPAWYFRGREGLATWEVPELQLPIRFVTPVGGELSESVAGAGRCLSVSFSRCLSPAVLPADQARRSARRGAAARRARAEATLAQLAAAAEAPDVELPNPVVRLLPGQARFQVGGAPGSPLPASSQNVLPFRRPPQQQPQQPQPQQHNAAGGSPLAAPPGSNNVQPPQSNSNSNSSSSSSSNSSGGSVSAGGEYVPVRQQNSSSSSSQQQQQQQQPTAGEAAAAAAAAASPPSNGGASSSSRSGPGPGRKVIQLLPWLLVSHGRLSGPELVHLAASRALTCLLELGLRLEPETGLLSPRGASPPAYEPPVLPVPPTLSPSSIPTPAPANPPPFPPGQQQQQQEAAAAAAAAAEAGQQQQQQQGEAQVEAGDRQGDGEREGAGGGVPGLLVAAGLAGIAGPDTGFASAAVAAAAAAAAVEAGAEAAERQQQDGGDAGSSSSSGGGDSSGDVADQQPSFVTLQAHHLLYCMADLQRLAVRRHWMRRRSAPSSSSSSSSGLPLQPPLQQQQQHFQQQQQQQQQQHYGSQLLLTCDEGSWPAVGLLLAAWLHWHCGLELAVAVEAVGGALGVTLDTSVLAEARRLLVVRAKERFSRLLLTWPYGGLSAEVSGELLGGWTERVAMKRCLKPEGCMGVAQGHFYLELAGLHPGRYHYKYIIDNTWAVDPLAPKALDSQGNWNNVLEVAPPPVIATPQEREHFAVLQAACAAFEAKAAPPRRRQQ